MDDEQGDRKRGLPEREAPRPLRGAHAPEARDRPRPDPHASPLGRQPPADAGRDTTPLTGGASVAGRRGAGATRGARGRGDELSAQRTDAEAPPLDATEIGGGKTHGTTRSGEEAV